jgi:hypothetical protein
LLRPSLFIVSHNLVMTDALSKYISALAPSFIKHHFDPQNHSITYSHVEEIHDFLARNEANVLLNSAIIFDYTEGPELTPDNLDPTMFWEDSCAPKDQTEPIGTILAQLILAYPEVYWIILGTDRHEPKSQPWKEHFINVSNIGECFDRLKRHQNGYRTIFDPSGMRSSIKLLILNKFEQLEVILEKIKKVLEEENLLSEEKKKTIINNLEQVLEKNKQTTKDATLENIKQVLEDENALTQKKKETIIDILKQTLSGIKQETKDVIINRINKCAVALDEELAFTFLNGYTAYRFGYKCYTVTSMGEMEALKCSGLNADLALEDLELKFSDMKPSIDKEKDDEWRINGNLDNEALIERRKHYPFLPEEISKRIIITGSRDDLGDFEKSKCRKPFPGMFNLYHYIQETEASSEGEHILPLIRANRNPFAQPYHLCANQKQEKVEDSRTISIKMLDICAQWPYCKETLKDNQTLKKNEAGTCVADHHSITNKVLTLGEILLMRARKVSQNVNVSTDAIYAATLALEGKELLYGRTATTSLEMYAMQTKMEVVAECSFLGIGQQIEVPERLSELASTTDKILRVNIKQSDSNQYMQSYNAQLEITNDIRITYKQYEQFDEEDSCINEIRKLSQGLHFFGKLGFLKRSWVLLGERYLNWLMCTGTNILMAIALIILFFADLFVVQTIVLPPSPSAIISGLTVYFDAFFRSAETFFSIQSNYGNVILENYKSFSLGFFHVVTLLEMILGFLHLGIFIAWIYQKLARR